ncbi:sensor histidine kinase [Streptococcus dentasini]
MFQPFQKTDPLYYVGLVFMIFPLGGVLWFDYPMWTLGPSLLFMIAYILIIHLRNQYQSILAVLWFYLLGYILGMTFAIEPNMMWFFFYLVNLLVWRFGDDMRSYRTISYMLGLLVVMMWGLFFTPTVIEKVMTVLITTFIIAMHYFQRQNYLESKVKEEIYQKNKEINLLTAENERNRIGRDLHDTLGHTFAMMTLKTELALKQLDKDNPVAVRKELLELKQISQKSMKDVRGLVNNLKYRTVAEELDNITEVFALSDIGLTVDNQLDLAALSPVIQSSMTMILRELTTNIIKHAGANQCHIKLYRTGELVIDVSDNGCGFAQLTGEELHSIKERLQLVKGDVVILSSQNPTLIRVTLEEGDGL